MKLFIHSEAILLRCTKMLIYLIPLLPLFIAPSVTYPYITGKNFAFRIIIELTSVFWLGLLVTNKTYRSHTSAISLSVLLFTFIVGIADVFGINPYRSFWSNYERMEGYVSILHLVLFFLIIKSIFKTRKDWAIFFSIYVVVSLMVSLFSFLEHSSIVQPPEYIGEYGHRIAGTIGNPPFLAAFLLLSVFLGLILIPMIQKTYFKLICVFSIFINVFVIYMTAARGVILSGLLGGIIIGITLIVRKFKNNNKTKFVILLFIILVLVGISSAIFIKNSDVNLLKKNKTVSRLMMISLDDRSIETRIEAWKLSYNGFKEKPILGWGQENFIGVYTVNPISIGDNPVWLDRAHNIVLDWLVNAGILGLFSYLAIFGSVFYMLRKNLKKIIISKNEFLIMTSALSVYFLQNLFTFDTISTYLIFFTIIAYIDNIEITRVDPCLNEIGNINDNTRVTPIVVTISAFFVFLVGSYFINYLPIKQLKVYSNISMFLPNYESYSKLSVDFNKALSYGPFGETYIRDLMQGVTRQIIKERLFEREGAIALIQKTVEEIGKELSANNLNLEYMINTSGFYQLLSQYDPSFIRAAETILKSCLLINPQYQRFDLDMIEIYFLKKDYVSAIDSIKKILRLKPAIAGLYYKLAVASILAKEVAETKTALDIYNKLRLTNHNTTSGIEPVYSIKQLNELAQAHMEVKNYKQAHKYYREILFNLSHYRGIRLAKGNTEALTDEEKTKVKAKIHLEIAKAYIAMGDEENAIIEARKASELSPSILNE